MRVACFDLGTNTLLMLIVELEAEGQMTVVADEHAIVRLGQDLDSTGVISQEALERARTQMREYNALCRDLAVDVRVGVATSAARRASNGTEIIKQLNLEFACGLRIIDGNEEANLTFKGSVESRDAATVIDIGGGSTEFVHGLNMEISRRRSLEIGAVRISETFKLNQAVDQRQLAEARDAIRTLLTDITPSEYQGELCGVAGTPTTLAAVDLMLREFDQSKVHGHRLTIERVDQLFSMLSELSIEDIAAVPGVHAKRADILVGGTLILRESMRHLGIKELLVSSRGLRYGVAIAASAHLQRRRS